MRSDGFNGFMRRMVGTLAFGIVLGLIGSVLFVSNDDDDNGDDGSNIRYDD